MAGKIFINYRRDDSIGMAGRLHDRLAQTFGRDKLFIDVDHIPVGVDFAEHLNSQVAACDAILVVIGPHWLDAKDESGDRRLDKPDDFVAIEIAAALARDIRVIPVLVDGAHMPKASQLPDSLKPLARRHAIEVRHAHFGHDAEALVARMREALGVEALGDEATVARGHEALGAASPNRRRFELHSRRRTVMAAAAVAVLLMVGWGGYAYVRHAGEGRAQQAELKQEEERRALVAEANRKVEEAEQQRLAAVKADQDRQARVASEAEAKRKTDEAERQRQANIRAEQERQARMAAEAEAKRKAEKERGAKGAAEVEAKPKAETPILIINDYYDINSVALAPDGRTALAGDANKKLKLWDLSSGRVIHTFTGHSGNVLSVAFAPDGRTALSGSSDGMVKLWDISSGQEIRTFKHDTTWGVVFVAFAPDGRTALSGSSSGNSSVKLWEVSSGREIREFKVGPNLRSFAIGPDGRNLRYATDRAVEVIEVADGEIIRRLGKGAHSGNITSVTFAPDGRTALTGGEDHTVKLWDIFSEREIRTFKGHSGRVNSVALALDGRTALSGSSDKTLKLWDVATGREIRTFFGHEEPVNSVAFSSDGRTALSGSKDDTLRLWDLTSLN
jgi:WD40 repeat protein